MEEKQMDNLENNKKGVRNVLLEIEKAWGSDVTISMINILLMIPYNKSISVQDIRRISTLTEGGVSRVLSTLNAHNIDNRRKLEKLVDIYLDEDDRRYRHVKLTSKGKDVVLGFMSYLNPLTETTA